jgi:hypothetical protein
MRNKGIPPKAVQPEEVIKHGYIEIQNKKIIFSFKYLDNQTRCFSPDLCAKGYIGKFTERLKGINGITVDQFEKDVTVRDAMGIEKIYWEKVADYDGFPNLSPQLEAEANENSWEFSITKNLHGRIHGFLSHCVFFIVWLDSNHSLFKRKR